MDINLRVDLFKATVNSLSLTFSFNLKEADIT